MELAEATKPLQSMNPEMRSVQVPAELCAEAEKKFGQRFASVDELVVFALR